MDFALLTLAAAFQAVKASYDPFDPERLGHICTLTTLLTSMSAVVERWKSGAVNDSNKGTPREEPTAKKRCRSPSPDGPEKKKKKKKKMKMVETAVDRLLKTVSPCTSDAPVKELSSDRGRGVGKKPVDLTKSAQGKEIVNKKKNPSRTKKPGTVQVQTPSQLRPHKQLEVKMKHPSTKPVQWSDDEATREPWEMSDSDLVRAVESSEAALRR